MDRKPRLFLKAARRLAVVALVGCSAATVEAPTASADEDPWVCNSYSSAQVCLAGTGHRSYIEITNSVGDEKFEVCAKGETDSGNLRTGSGCNPNSFGRVSCFNSGSPNNAAYIYWAGTGGTTYNLGRARTPASRTYC